MNILIWLKKNVYIYINHLRAESIFITYWLDRGLNPGLQASQPGCVHSITTTLWLNRQKSMLINKDKGSGITRDTFSVLDLTYKFIEVTNSKKPFLTLRGYTYRQTNQDDRHWSCTTRTRTRCQARLRFNDHKEIVFHKLTHNHSAPRYFKTSTGKYVKVRE